MQKRRYSTAKRKLRYESDEEQDSYYSSDGDTQMYHADSMQSSSQQSVSSSSVEDYTTTGAPAPAARYIDDQQYNFDSPQTLAAVEMQLAKVLRMKYWPCMRTADDITAWVQRNYVPIVSGSTLYKFMDMAHTLFALQYNQHTKTALNPAIDRDFANMAQTTKLEAAYSSFYGRVMQHRCIKLLQQAFKFKIHDIASRSAQDDECITSEADGIVFNAIRGYPVLAFECKNPYNGMLPQQVPLEDYLQCQTHCDCLDLPGSLYVKCSPAGIVIFLVERDKQLWHDLVLARVVQNRKRLGNRQEIRDTHDDYTQRAQRIQIAVALAHSRQQHSKCVAFYCKLPKAKNGSYRAGLHVFHDLLVEQPDVVLLHATDLLRDPPRKCGNAYTTERFGFNTNALTQLLPVQAPLTVVSSAGQATMPLFQ